MTDQLNIAKQELLEPAGLDEAKLKAQQLVNEANLALEQIDADTSSLSQLAQYIIERDH